MRMQSLILESAVIATLVALVNIATASRARACSCLAPTVASSYHSASDVAYIDIRRTFVASDTRYYVGYVAQTFKGCLVAAQRVILKTPVSSATCGSELRLLRRYLINGNAAGSVLGTRVLSISLCSYDRQVSELSEQDQAFLNGRSVCCGDKCGCADGSQPVQCLVEPCSMAPYCPDGECVANYCGGCNAEFFDERGELVCEGPSECASDADCASGTWCRQAQSGGYECVPFVGEGSRCAGFTLPWLYQRCEPGLTCDTPELIADAPGICRPSCKSSADCKELSYCASDKLCDDDGACEREVDCNLPGNLYAAPKCLGYGVCGQDQHCGWVCGSPQCVNLAGLELGPCDAVLGWGVIDGRCTALSGCSAEPFKLFASSDECRNTCMP